MQSERSRLYHSEVIERGVLSGAFGSIDPNVFCFLFFSPSSLRVTTTAQASSGNQP